MKRIGHEVLASTPSERMEEMTNRIEDKIAHFMVSNKEYQNEGVLPEPNGVLCSLCRRNNAEHDLIIAGHTVSICTKCISSLNSCDLEQVACGKKLAI
jgi:hypothetical protein